MSPQLLLQQETSLLAACSSLLLQGTFTMSHATAPTSLCALSLNKHRDKCVYKSVQVCECSALSLAPTLVNLIPLVGLDLQCMGRLPLIPMGFTHNLHKLHAPVHIREMAFNAIVHSVVLKEHAEISGDFTAHREAGF